MADRVPTSGPWQTDATLQQLMTAKFEEDSRLSKQHYRSVGTGSASLEYARYVERNRRALGIPNNYWPDPRTGGRTLYDGNQNVWRNVILTGGTMAVGGYALGAALPAAAAPASATTVIPGTGIPVVSGTGPGLVAPAAAGAAGGAAKKIADKIGDKGDDKAAVPTFGDKVKDFFTDPKDVAGLAALIPLLTNALRNPPGGDDPFGNSAVSGEIAQSLAMQRKRIEQTQPALDTLVNMSYGMSPTRYRGPAPSGYTPNEAPKGPYQYESPKFS